MSRGPVSCESRSARREGRQMRQRYFIIEPKYSDPDTFCNFIVGSDRVRASIQIYADIEHLRAVAAALEAQKLEVECRPLWDDYPDDDGGFDLKITVLPHEGVEKTINVRIVQSWPDDGTPYRAEISFQLTAEEAAGFSLELAAWCRQPEYAFIWKGD